jgi:hypothetical protein
MNVIIVRIDIVYTIWYAKTLHVNLSAHLGTIIGVLNAKFKSEFAVELL